MVRVKHALIWGVGLESLLNCMLQINIGIDGLDKESLDLTARIHLASYKRQTIFILKPLLLQFFAVQCLWRYFKFLQVLD